MTKRWAGPELVQSMYRGMGIDRRSLIAELLEETDPLPFYPRAKGTEVIARDGSGYL